MILCAGLSPAWQETLFFDELRIGEVNRAREVHWIASGKVLNAARAAASLGRGKGAGLAARAITVLGGPSGDAAERSLAAEGMDLVAVRTVAPTRVCNTVINRADGTITELVENAGPLSAGELDAFRARFLDNLEGARAVILTGSLTAGAPADLYHSLIAKASVPVILDARGPELVEALKLKPFLVKPNREELSKTIGRPIAGEADLRSAMLDLAGRGAGWVVVSQGRDAVWALGEGKFWRFRPPRVKTVNPIGSGDCLAAGVAHAILEGAEVIEAIRLGIACGAENASTTLPAFTDPQAVARRLAEVTVEPAQSHVELTVEQISLLVGSSIGAGIMNAIAGGGTILTYPALIFSGESAIVANATSTVALWPGAATSMFGYRREVMEHKEWLRLLLIPSLLGGAIGAVLLLLTPPRLFESLAPFLVLFATVLFFIQGLLARRTSSSPEVSRRVPGRLPIAWLSQFGLAIYGGYFGAGIGILMLTVLGFLGLRDIHAANGTKNFLGMCINAVAAAYFIFRGVVNWPAVLIMVAGAMAGGYAGARMARKIGRARARGAVVVIGLLVTVVLLWRRFAV